VQYQRASPSGTPVSSNVAQDSQKMKAGLVHTAQSCAVISVNVHVVGG